MYSFEALPVIMEKMVFMREMMGRVCSLGITNQVVA
jgi:hypothetical protein